MRPTDPDWDDEGIVSLFIGTFAARDDLYVENGAEVRRATLSPEVLRKAVKHNYAVSGYLARPDGRTHVGAIDFDRLDGMDLAKQIAAFLIEHEIPSLIVQSRRGAHLWVTCVDWSKAGTMHRMLSAAVTLATGIEGDPKIEVFPKRGDDLAAGALRMPGTPHQKTQQVYPIWTWDEKPVQDTLRGVIEAHQLTTHTAVERLAGSTSVPVEYPKVNHEFYGYKPPATWTHDPSASEVLIAWGVPNAKPGGTVPCPKHQDRHRSLTIFRDDKRVYCGSPACVLNNGGHGVGSVMLSRMDA